ncbi:hypothetical protein Fmac_010958 [Flemingia macrophylla]|uniref:Disease resistance protein At4g27190-like leucine-rich repeats domain-containing protein n=1 Tax=Flemingia macrophylla TaxID=520843 RepID=A0ABD1MLV9_9FABA
MHRLKDLTISSDSYGEEIDLYRFLYRMPNLEKLSLERIQPITANITTQQFGVVLHLQELVLSSCDNLSVLAPPSVSLTYLTFLEVKACRELRNLMASSTAKSLVQLKTMKVSFRHSEHLYLSRYPELIQQLWRPCKLQNYFGNLKRLIAWGCDSLVHVIPSHLLSCFENLEELIVISCSETEVIFNITDEIREQKKPLGIIRLKRLILWSLPKLEHVWKKDSEGIIDLQVLRVMTVRECNSLRSLFPAKKDMSLRLEELEVKECSELVEIFAKGSEEEGTKKLVFSCLLSLTLRELPRLKYLYAVECDGEEELLIQIQKNVQLAFVWCNFDEMFSAERPNADYTSGILLQLKGLELRDVGSLKSIGLEHSWVQPFSKNLQTLQVIGCGSLVYLFTSSTAKSLGRLKRLEITKCKSMKEIVSVSMENKSDEDEEIIFEQLEVLYLEELDELRCFYSGNSTLHFPCLKQVYLIHCWSMKSFSRYNRIDNSIEWFTEEDGTPQQCSSDFNTDVHRNFQEKRDLRIALTTRAPLHLHMKKTHLPRTLEMKNNDDLMQLRDDLNTPAPPPCRSTSSLSRFWSLHIIYHIDLHLSYNPLLQAIWLGSPVSIPKTCFNELVSLTVEYCEFLADAVLPFNLLPLFTKLKTLKVGGCDNVNAIFDVKCITQNRGPTPIPFLLENLTLLKLPNLKNVWNEHPDGILRMQLLQVKVTECDCLTSVFPASMAKELVKLEIQAVEKCEELIRIVGEDNGDRNVELTVGCPSLTFLKLCGLPNLKYFYNCSPLLIEKLPKLEHLAIGSENVLKIIKGNILHNLKVVTFSNFDESDIFPYEFVEHVPNTDRLEVRDSSFKDIFCLQNPNTDEFLSHHKELRMDSLPNLTQSATFFSNVTYLQVSGCNALLYLFTSSIVKGLAHLKSMKIEVCDSIEEIVVCRDESNEDEIIFPHLNCLTLEYLKKLTNFYKGSLCFPSLNQLVISRCSSMETLCEGTIKAEKLFQVKLDYDPILLKTDLNSTLMNAFLAEASFLDLNKSKLQEIWLHLKLIPDKWFSKLDTLVMDGCQFLSNAVLPFHLLPFFYKLETLEVRNCDYVKTIFDVRCVKQDKEMATMGQHSFPLKILILSNLPNLKNVWNKDPQGILRMQLLQEIDVDNCKCLTSVCPASVVKNIMTLEILVVKHCERLMAIVEEDNNVDPRGKNLKLTFQYVTSFTLCDLPKFKYNAKCSLQDATSTFELPPNLQHLALGENELEMIWRDDFLGNLLHNLKVLTFLHFKPVVFPYKFLQQVPNIEKLEVRDSSFKEIFSFQSPGMDHAVLLSQLKELCLDSLPYLVCIGLENSWIEPFLKNLETLQVESCNNLLYLFKFSTTKSLAQLKTMEIKQCKSIKNIVFKEQDESHKDEIIFEKLSCLHLEDLPHLDNFYQGSLSFPFLKELIVTDCYKMSTLCAGIVKAEKLSEIKLERSSAYISLENDLNSTMWEAFLSRISKSAQRVSYLRLRDNPQLQVIWEGSLSIPGLCFSNLHSLIVDGCHFLSDEVLPCNLLPLLTNLVILEVRKCDNVKTIFDVKCTTQEKIMTTMGPALKKLILKKLPSLENIWNEDPHGILGLQLLQHIYVDNCKGLTRVFPATAAKDLVILKNLVVQHCEGLMAIVCDVLKTFTHLEPYTENQVSIEKLTPNLQYLVVGQNEMEMIWHGEFQENLLHKLKVLILLNFNIESNVFSYGHLQQVPNVDEIEMSCSFKVIFCDGSLNVDDIGLQSHMKILGLESIPKPFLRNVEALEREFEFSILSTIVNNPVSQNGNLLCR